MEMKPTLWAKKYNLKTEKGLPIDFHDHLFMYDIWNVVAEEPLVCAMKAAQVSFSTMCIFVSFFVAKNKGMDGIYTLPTSSERSEFVSDKVNRIIAQNPVLQGYTVDRDTIEQKQVGDNMIHYRSTWKEKNATTVSSDVNYYDEVDTSNLMVIDQYATRLQHSPYKWERFFSHPSSEATGVHKYWLMSDQRHWVIKCNHCGKEQYMSWSITNPKKMSIDLKREMFVCKHCGKELSKEARRVGVWKPRYKRSDDRPFVGYWIPLLIAPWVSAKEIITYWKKKSPEYFNNKVLGLPHSSRGNKLSKKNLKDNFTNENLYPSEKERVVIGVDTGKNLHFVVGGEKGIFYYGVADDYDEIERLMDRWPRAVAIVDQGGDLIGSRKLREKYRGRVYLCAYGEDRKTLELVRWGKKDELGMVIADRNRMIQLVVDEYTDKRIPVMVEEPLSEIFEFDQSEWFDYWLHWNNLSRKKEQDENGRIRMVWQRSGDDHWAHATVYWRVGISRFVGRGFIIRGNTEKKPNSYMVTPDDKTSRNPLKPVIDKTYEPPEEDDWRATG